VDAAELTVPALTDLVEQVSTAYSRRLGFERDADWFLLKLQEEVGELTQAYLRCKGQARGGDRPADQLRSELGAELADVLAHVLLLARSHGIDVPAELDRKWLVRLSEGPTGG
jgi:NTP pyrophosphatase (non-canonical NTP hydrolase)